MAENLDNTIRDNAASCHTGDSMAENLDNTIRDNAAGPKRASGDSGSVEQHSLADQIEADKYLAGKDAVSKNPAKAFTRVKIVPPGTV